ncbi:homeodomain-interacting protein kinase 1-like [Xiphias gladius]|uniref:homeodomain-interacting protein kinase 1-like n=1 Tax=Xiphias gladius TaxID=8245 RepID=UPI001A99BE95|nr:homeodomain-interacting protein kinase 1-like [Xiphias gladius]
MGGLSCSQEGQAQDTQGRNTTVECLTDTLSCETLMLDSDPAAPPGTTEDANAPEEIQTVYGCRHIRRKDLEIEEHDVLSGKTTGYLIEKFLGQGTFGKVAQCIRLDTKERMAVKIVRKDLAWAGETEVAMLKKLRQLDQDKNNLVRFFEHFKHRGYVCLAFEMLDISIYDFMKERSFKPLDLSEIRVITQQMLVALNALKGIGLAHADIKLDNIMLVNHQLQPFKLKLIDFGLAVPVSKMWLGMQIQVLGYRAPEVILGLPLNEAADMWSLGCVLAFMYLGQHLYPIECEYEPV